MSVDPARRGPQGVEAASEETCEVCEPPAWLDIPMFDMEPAPASSRTRSTGPKPVAWANCPGCTAIKIGLLTQGKHLTWRPHTYTTWGGAQMACPSSGITICVLPSKDGYMTAADTIANRRDGEKLYRPARCAHGEDDT